MNYTTWEQRVRKVEPYTPGEQPKTDNVIKLNTNENPFPPSPMVEKVIKEVKKPYKVKKSDAVAGTLLLSKGASMTSWGEDYPIIVKKISDKACRVEVEFKRKYALQATGKGQHKKCIEYLKGILLK